MAISLLQLVFDKMLVVTANIHQPLGWTKSASSVIWFPWSKLYKIILCQHPLFDIGNNIIEGHSYKRKKIFAGFINFPKGLFLNLSIIQLLLLCATCVYVPMGVCSVRALFVDDFPMMQTVPWCHFSSALYYTLHLWYDLWFNTKVPLPSWASQVGRSSR